MTIFANDELAKQLALIESELRFVFITSQVNVVNGAAADNAIATEIDGLSVLVEPSTGEKCERCWHHRDEVGSNEAHVTLCGRCVTNIEGEGEVRHYA